MIKVSKDILFKVSNVNNSLSKDRLLMLFDKDDGHESIILDDGRVSYGPDVVGVLNKKQIKEVLTRQHIKSKEDKYYALLDERIKELADAYNVPVKIASDIMKEGWDLACELRDEISERGC